MQNTKSIRSRAAAAGAAIAMALATTPALAIEAFSADYQANYMGMEAKATMSLASTGKDRWKYSIDIGGMGAELQ